MIQIAIVEDNEDCVNQIKRYIRQFSTEQNTKTKTNVFSSGEAFLFDDQSIYDVVLMDIDLPKKDGMETARQLRERDTYAEIIFITNLAQYAKDGYRVKARAYVLKPINYYGFAMELSSAIEELNRKRAKYILLTYRGGAIKVNVKDIKYIESQRHHLMVNTTEEVITIRNSMNNMEKQLKNQYFERSNVSFLINLAYVDAINTKSAIIGDEELPISRQKRKSFMEALTDYIGGI